jgi:hypothetical protein
LTHFRVTWELYTMHFLNVMCIVIVSHLQFYCGLTVAGEVVFENINEVLALVVAKRC